MKKSSLNRTAFTMLELVFVIIVIGIISALAIPRFDRQNLREAADQIVSHIRYTQHLAMQDNKFDPNDANWFHSRWHIRFLEDPGTTTDEVYYIMSDAADDITNPNSFATNPQNPAVRLTGDTGAGSLATPELNIGDKYGIATMTNTCAADANEVRIIFDHMGRPYHDDNYHAGSTYQDLITAPCNIVISDASGDSETIIIQPETGYVSIQ